MLAAGWSVLIMTFNALILLMLLLHLSLSLSSFPHRLHRQERVAHQHTCGDRSKRIISDVEWWAYSKMLTVPVEKREGRKKSFPLFLKERRKKEERTNTYLCSDSCSVLCLSTQKCSTFYGTLLSQTYRLSTRTLWTGTRTTRASPSWRRSRRSNTKATWNLWYSQEVGRWVYPYELDVSLRRPHSLVN